MRSVDGLRKEAIVFHVGQTSLSAFQSRRQECLPHVKLKHQIPIQPKDQHDHRRHDQDRVEPNQRVFRSLLHQFLAQYSGSVNDLSNSSGAGYKRAAPWTNWPDPGSGCALCRRSRTSWRAAHAPRPRNNGRLIRSARCSRAAWTGPRCTLPKNSSGTVTTSFMIGSSSTMLFLSAFMRRVVGGRLEGDFVRTFRVGRARRRSPLARRAPESRARPIAGPTSGRVPRRRRTPD